MDLNSNDLTFNPSTLTLTINNPADSSVFKSDGTGFKIIVIKGGSSVDSNYAFVELEYTVKYWVDNSVPTFSGSINDVTIMQGDTETITVSPSIYSDP